MFSIQDRMSRAAREQIMGQLEAGLRLADNAMHSLRQMTELHINLARATWDQSNFATRQFVSVQDAEHFFSLAAAQIQPNARRVLDYGYYLTTITAKAQAGLIALVGGRVADTSNQLGVLAAEVDREVPSGVRSALLLLGAMVNGVHAAQGELAHAKQASLNALRGGRNPPGERATRGKRRFARE